MLVREPHTGGAVALSEFRLRHPDQENRTCNVLSVPRFQQAPTLVGVRCRQDKRRIHEPASREVGNAHMKRRKPRVRPSDHLLTPARPPLSSVQSKAM